MKLEQRDSVALLAMNAGKANAIGPEWLERMSALLDELERSGARSLVVTGYESFFSAGLDLPSLIELDRAAMTRFIERFSDVMLRLFELPRPVVAAVNGHAVAGGCVLALQADVRIMADGPAKIGLNEVALGIGLPAGVVESLRCQVPASSLLPIAFEGKLVTAKEALALGLVHEVVPAAGLLDRALARARELGELPAAAFAHVKRQVRGPVAKTIRAATGDAGPWIDSWLSDEGQKRIRAAVERLSRKK